MQLCARDRWKLRVFFGTEIFMGQEPHGSSQWPWICCSSSWGRMDPGHRSSEGAREELSHRGTLPAPDCGLRGLQKPPNAFPKAAGSHWGRYILGCSRGMGGFIQTIHRDQEPASASLPGWNLGFFFFLLQFFPLPSRSLSFWPIFVFCRGSGVFLKQLFRRRLLSDGRSVGKSSLPPAIAPPTRPALLLLLLRAAAAFWSMQRNTAPEGGRAVKIASCSLLGLRFSLRELWPSGLVRTYFSPTVPSGDIFPHDPI